MSGRLSLAEKYFAFVEHHTHAVLTVLFVSFVISMLYSTQNFSIKSDFDGLIKPSTNNDWYWDNEQYKAAFPQNEKTALVVVSSVSAQKAYETGRKLADTLRSLAKDNSPIASVYAPQYDNFFDQHALYYAPVEGVRQVTDALKDQLPSLSELAKNPNAISAITYYETLLQDEEALLSDRLKTALKQLTSLLSKSKSVNLTFVDPLSQRDTEAMHYALILINANLDTGNDNPNKQVIDALQKGINQISLDSEVSVRITGEIALANDEITAALSGVELSGLISLVLLFLILLIGVRYKRLIVGIFILLVAGICWTVALSLFFVGHFNTLSLIFMVMFFGLAVDFAVHFSLAYLESGKQAKSFDVFKRIGGALLLCSVTSSIAFLSFTPTDYIGFAELGLISAIGMLVAIFLTLTFLPAWLALFSKRKPLKPLRLKGGNPTYSFQTALVVCLASLIFLISGGYYATKTTFDFSVLAMQDTNSEAMTVLSELHHQGFSSDYALAILVDESIDQAQLVNQLKQIESVKSVKIVEEYLPKFQSLKQPMMKPLGDEISQISVANPQALDKEQLQIKLDSFKSVLAKKSPDFFDEEQEVFHQLILAIDQFELNASSVNQLNLAASLGLAQDFQNLTKRLLTPPATLESLPAALKSRLISEGGKKLIQVVPDIDVTDHEALEAFISEVSLVSPNLAGRAIVEWGVGNTVQDAFIEAITLAVLIIFLLLVVCYRSLLFPLMVFVPLAMTTVFIFNLIYWTGFSLNMANILVVPLIFGLGVDTGLHILHQMKLGANTDQAQTSGSSTHRAVLISALTTIGTFFSLAFSSHNGAASIGILLSMAIAFLIVVSFFLLPALFTVYTHCSKTNSARLTT